MLGLVTAPRTTLGVAASMMVATHPMLRYGVEYQNLRGDHFDRRVRANVANRLIRRLEEVGLQVKVDPAAA